METFCFNRLVEGGRFLEELSYHAIKPLTRTLWEKVERDGQDY